MADGAMRSERDLTERVVGSRTVYRGHYLELQLAEIERADGSRAQREVVAHPGAVTILAVDDRGRVLVVRQWRVPAGRALLELPAGTLDRDPDTGVTEDPLLAAARELEEETGQRAGQWELLGTFWTAPGFATELMYLYLAGDLRPADGESRGPDPDERLEVERIPWRQAVEMAERGEIADAKSLVGLFWLARRRAPPARRPAAFVRRRSNAGDRSAAADPSPGAQPSPANLPDPEPRPSPARSGRAPARRANASR
jgi:ADP-ribose pyrophosphatase